MSTPQRIAAFGVGLAAIFGLALGAGRFFATEEAGGYTLRVDAASATPAQPGAPVPIRFAVLDGNDTVVTDFVVRHEKSLHLIAVRADFAQYRHLHPRMGPEGTWSVDADLAPGPWRLFADFQPGGGDLQVLTTDLEVDGGYSPETPGNSSERRSALVEGYSIEVQGHLEAGTDSSLAFQVYRDDEPVADLEPYLGAYGHLVVLRETDLDYLHAHPGTGPAGPEIPFEVGVPTVGRYQLFLDFKHNGVVRTATFALDAIPGTEGAPEGHESGGMNHGEH